MSLTRMGSAVQAALRLSVLAACSAPAFCFPSLPSFSASVVLHPQAMTQSNLTMSPYFRDVTLKLDAATGRSEWRLIHTTWDFISPAFEYLASRQVCDGRRCRVSSRNGTQFCGEGTVGNLGVLEELWARMAQEAEHQGPREVGGVSCELWGLKVPSSGNMTACIGKDGVPRSMVVEASIERVGFSNIFPTSFNMTFEDIRLWATSGAEQIESVACPSVKEGSCTGGGVESFQVLRASMGRGEPWGELFDRDSFDWAGAGVTLGTPEQPAFVTMKYLEVFDVEANSSFARWRDCNYHPAAKKYVCVSSPPKFSPEEARLVSRSSAEQLEAGQCGKNEQVGSWLVFPHEGRCDGGQAVGDAGCTWKVKSAKVVEMECMQSFDSDGWSRAWAQDYQKAPFPAVQRHIKAAVAACPDIRDARLI